MAPPRDATASSFLAARVASLQARILTIRRNVSLLLIYLTVFLDFIGITLLSPGMRFMVDPTHPDAFDDVRRVPACDGPNQTLAAPCGDFALQPGAAISIMLFSFGVGQLLAMPLMGAASDRLGARRILMISTAGTAATFVLQGLAWSFWWHAGARFLSGLFAGSRPVCQAYIAASVPRHRRAEMMGYMALSVMGAMQFGPVLGGSLALVNLRLPLFTAAGIAAVALVMQMKYLEEASELHPSQPPPTPKHETAAREATARHRGTRRLLIVFAGSTMFQMMSHPVCLPILLADKFGLDANQIGLLQWGDGIVLMVGNQIFTRLAARRGVCVVACTGALLSIFQSGIGFSASLPVLTVFRSLSMLGPPMCQPVAPAIVSLVAPPKRMGAWMAAVSASSTLIRAIAPPLLGPLYDVNPAIPFLVTASAASLTILCASLLNSRVPTANETSTLSEIPSASMGLASIDEPAAATADVLANDSADSRHAEHGVEPSELDDSTTLRTLELEYERLLLVQKKLLDGEEVEDVDLTAEVTEADVEELGRWMGQMLERQGYRHWFQHKDAIRAIAQHSFPRIRETPRVSRVTDILGVLGAHFEFERTWASHRWAQQEHCAEVGSQYM
ncbi:hypothetical protein AB1Y20_001036 [Prymnesium parvum]|uniref:Major facilitator superfamily (MFS) profile domain-containing protein n=1 Tax=Prymnesium parvum TaxID=97485 RepID=A0AB34KBG4_PRYPA